MISPVCGTGENLFSKEMVSLRETAEEIFLFLKILTQIFAKIFKLTLGTLIYHQNLILSF